MKRFLKLKIAIVVALVICCLTNINAFSKHCDSIRDKMLRMHVIANSDSKDDQQLKLKVRDAVLCKGEEIFDGSITANEAKSKITPYIDTLEKTAMEVVINEGYDYKVKVTIEEEYFKTRTYDDLVTLPAGNYTAIKVIIGEGQGQNWWCVMFPPMCLPAAESKCSLDDVLNLDESNIVSNGQRYKLKFKIVEIWEEFFKK